MKANSPLRVPRRLRPSSLFLPSLLSLFFVTALVPQSNARRAPLSDGAEQGEDQPDPPRILAWNDLGMHCIDPDFSIFALLPPFNTINVQVVLDGQLLTTSSGLHVTYEAFADASGSINSTSIGKTNFWDHEEALFGISLPVDVGLAGYAMPGPANVPQPMSFDGTWSWFHGEGIPITPLDDAQQKNPYPLAKVELSDGAGTVLASTVTSVPNSQEIHCNLCHASGGSPYARPDSGWEYDPDPIKDDRWNILRLHDDRHRDDPAYAAALAGAGYNANGLVETVRSDGTSVLCARCHGSNALPGTGQPGVSPMTQAIHSLHAGVVDPTGSTLDETSGRASCYSCHPGQDTKCLRGAMGTAIADSGDFAMDCQSCHDDLSAVGDPARAGWFDQPTCQNCHTGSAIQNSGEIRYASAFDDSGELRTAASQLFATTPDTPAAGYSLYRFSSGHGELQCSACHGPPHAIYPTSEANDNLQNELVQGHEGTLVDCSACHASLEDDELVGPHGMHPVDLAWATDKHGGVAETNGTASCQACHGPDLRGTVLSRAHGDRSFSTQFGDKTFWRGFEIGCYDCHDGPDGENPSGNAAPVVPDLAFSTPNDVPLALTLSGSDANGDALSFRIVSQPEHGSVGLNGTSATFFPEPGHIGPSSFTYAASDGSTDSNLGTLTVESTSPDCPGSVEAYGFGSPGSGDLMPTLTLSGCPTPGGTVEFELDQALGGSVAFLIGGTSRVNVEVFPGIALRVLPIAYHIGPIRLAGSGAGQGSFRYSVQIPADTLPSTLTAQAYVIDPGSASLISTTNGIELQIR